MKALESSELSVGKAAKFFEVPYLTLSDRVKGLNGSIYGCATSNLKQEHRPKVDKYQVIRGDE